MNQRNVRAVAVGKARAARRQRKRQRQSGDYRHLRQQSQLRSEVWP